MRPFVYEAAQDADAAMRMAITHGPSTQYLAGGTNLLDLMKIGVAKPVALVNIGGLRAEYGAISADADGLHLGALVRMAEAAEHPAVLRDYPVIAQSLQRAASQQLRNMATLAGNAL